MITIIYKTGKKDSQDGRLFKSRRKNAKEVNEETDNKLYPQSSDEVNNLYSYPMDNTCGDGVSAVKGRREIVTKALDFRDFSAYDTFERVEQVSICGNLSKDNPARKV